MATSKIVLRIFRFCPLKYNANAILQYQNTRCMSSSTNGHVKNDEFASTNHEDQEYEENIKKKILAASLQFVPTHGWTKEAIGAGADSLGYSTASRGLFKNSGVSLVYFFQESCNEKLNLQLAERKEQQKTNSDTLIEIQDALQLRLGLITPYIPQWPQAMALMAAPPNTPTSLKLLLNLADDICHHAGVNSIDMSWYKDRATVAGLYLAGELSLIQDKSPDFTDTWKFLERRIEELRRIKKCEDAAQTSSKQFVDISKAAITTNLWGLRHEVFTVQLKEKLRNIFGFNSSNR